MKKNLIILFLVFLTIVNISALVTFTYQRWHFRREFPSTIPHKLQMNFFQQELGLSDDQVKEIESLRNVFEQETATLVDSLKSERMDLMREVATENPNIEKIKKAIEKIGTMQMELEKKVIFLLLKEKSILTTEQQKRLLLLLEEGRERMEKMPKHGKMNLLPMFYD